MSNGRTTTGRQLLSVNPRTTQKKNQITKRKHRELIEHRNNLNYTDDDDNPTNDIVFKRDRRSKSIPGSPNDLEISCRKLANFSNNNNVTEEPVEPLSKVEKHAVAFDPSVNKGTKNDDESRVNSGKIKESSSGIRKRYLEANTSDPVENIDNKDQPSQVLRPESPLTTTYVADENPHQLARSSLTVHENFSFDAKYVESTNREGSLILDHRANVSSDDYLDNYTSEDNRTDVPISMQHFIHPQTGSVSLLYVLYRIAIAVYFSSIILWSLVCTGFTHFWLVYLTNWTFTAQTMHTIIQAIYVCGQYINGQEVHLDSYGGEDTHASDLGRGTENRSSRNYRSGGGSAGSLASLDAPGGHGSSRHQQLHQLPLLLQIDWVLHNIVNSMAPIVSLVYWTMLYDGWTLGLISVTTHALNSMCVLFDLFIMRVPVHLNQMYQPIVYGLTYTAVTFIYWFNGGMSINGDDYIYPILDYSSHPWRALTVVCCTTMCTGFIHYFNYHLVRYRGEGPRQQLRSNQSEHVSRRRRRRVNRTPSRTNNDNAQRTTRQRTVRSH